MLATSWGREQNVLYMFYHVTAAVNMAVQGERSAAASS
jgi:hypothetical protein